MWCYLSTGQLYTNQSCTFSYMCNLRSVSYGFNVYRKWFFKIVKTYLCDQYRLKIDNLITIYRVSSRHPAKEFNDFNIYKNSYEWITSVLYLYICILKCTVLNLYLYAVSISLSYILTLNPYTYTVISICSFVYFYRCMLMLIFILIWICTIAPIAWWTRVSSTKY